LVCQTSNNVKLGNHAMPCIMLRSNPLGATLS
jgi:hypothetical protein